MNFKNQILLLTEFFNSEKYDYALIGAFALHAYGYTRATKGVDFITRLEYKEKLVKYLESIDFETLNQSDAFSNHVYPAGSVRFDILYVEGETANSIFKSIGQKIMYDDLNIPVVSPEHLIALKLFAASSDPDRKFKELSDITELIKITDVNENTIKKYFEKCNLEEYYNEITRKK